MPGLLSKQQGRPGTEQQPGMMPQEQGTPMQQQSAAGEDEPNASPEEQASYDQWVANGMQLLYDEATMPQILKSIEGDGSPVEGIANSLASLVMRLEDSSAKQGTEISGDVKFHGATELLEQMIELAEEAGVHKFTEEETESALFLAFDIYRSTRQEQGQLPEEAIAQDMQALLQAEQQGNLEELLPGIREYAANAPKPAQQQAPPRRGLMRG